MFSKASKRPVCPKNIFRQFFRSCKMVEFRHFAHQAMHHVHGSRTKLLVVQCSVTPYIHNSSMLHRSKERPGLGPEAPGPFIPYPPPGILGPVEPHVSQT